MKVLEIKNVHKIYNSSEVKVHAVNDISLDFEKGEFAAIVGPSGSGKLKSSGLIDFRMRNIGFVFQSYNLIPVLTAKENVEFIMSLQKWDKKEMNERTVELLKAVGLEDRINSRPSKLSGGQQQRVAVARALASKPKFVLADEPTANLDSKSTETLLDIMEQLNKDEGITFIFSTHDARVVKKARRVITVEDGKVISDKRKI